MLVPFFLTELPLAAVWQLLKITSAFASLFLAWGVQNS